ncbi:MAG: PEP-CTERM sorting domain-containing protein [Candidatus Brocadiae bacterium]|nr:PEP-CTERM sorting domain-containing protein [Candidatus Brocadiia bacterium]
MKNFTFILVFLCLCLAVQAVPDLSWMNTNDSFHGLRQSTYNSKVWFAVSQSNVWEPSRLYDVPDGYHWATTAEGNAIFGTNGNYSGTYVYYNQGGWSGYNFQGLTRHYFRFSDSNVTNAYKHAGNYDEYQLQYTSSTSYFAGLVLIQNVPEPATLFSILLGILGFLAYKKK